MRWTAAPGPAPVPDAGPGCEPVRDGLLAEPVSAVTSLAFVVAAALIVLLARRSARRSASDDTQRPPGPVTGYALLVAGIGVGSVIQHGPDPPGADLAHDLPLVATLAFVAADSFADLARRPRTWWWWAVPSLALVPLILAAPLVADGVQVAVATVAVGLTLLRAARRPATRVRVLAAVAVLAVGATIGTLSRAGGPLCVPESIWQGHAAWHVLASTALVVLAPVLGLSPSRDSDRR
ncbi:hypothetical protein [Actinotalea sp. K2]|uniref:hypothetical protein n=1 Tax=Actinotalea sp. K2 TaxID=2939438 RepID=UPI0020170C95|nr:hypothetical protein [Actinotalea sp. K2]MCL3859746.1 hypothetical protein [Actinotalea sp. K2]